MPAKESAVGNVGVLRIFKLTSLRDWGQPILFHTWGRPFNPDYLGIGGHAGSFLGFLAVLMQASFSFFGSEVPGIVGDRHSSSSEV